MSTSINNKHLFLQHNSSSPCSIGLDLTTTNYTKSGYFFDNLLLPLQHHNNKLSNERNYSYSTNSSPILPSINSFNVTGKKSFTAPASPTHYDYGKNMSSILTPQTSPMYNKAHIISEIGVKLKHLNHFPLPMDNPSQIKMLDRLPQDQLTRLQSSSPFSASTSRLGKQNKINKKKLNSKSNSSLPSLKHLKLLPNPKIQQNSHIYPDTSEITPLWKDNLFNWCKDANYQDYKKIINLKVPMMNADINDAHHDFLNVPSVLEPKDAFQGLSDSQWDNELPVTPPMSPKRNQSSQTRRVPYGNYDEVVETSASLNTQQNNKNKLTFTPFVSEKLVQLVKKQRQNFSTPLTPTKTPVTSGHKKTNSFKALQIKKILNNRDVLSANSKRVQKPSNSKTHHVINQSTLSSPTHIQIGNNARQLTKKLDQFNNNINLTRNRNYANGDDMTTASTVSTPSSSPKLGPQLITQPRSRSRSRSRSPVRTNIPQLASPAKYHKFSLESPPQSPKRQNSIVSVGSTPRRRSTGHHHNIPRKCLSCQSSDSPCWRPSWSPKKQDQLCNSCGLRYKKTHTRCLNESCKKIPTKGELNIMRSNGIERGTMEGLGDVEGYRCLFCNSITETKSA